MLREKSITALLRDSSLAHSLPSFHSHSADESSSRLMQTFYQRLTAQTAPAKADALRAAQLSLLKDATTRHPFHWAPFVFVGDWR